MFYKLCLLLMMFFPILLFLDEIKKAKLVKRIIILAYPLIYCLLIVCEIVNIHFNIFSIEFNVTIPFLLSIIYISYNLFLKKGIKTDDLLKMSLFYLVDILAKFVFSLIADIDFNLINDLYGTYYFSNIFVLEYIFVFFIGFALILVLKGHMILTKAAILFSSYISIVLLVFLIMMQKMLYTYFQNNDIMYNYCIMIITLFTLAIISSIFILYYYSLKVINLSNKINENKINTMNEYYQKVNLISQDELIKMRHDIKNMLQVSKMYNETIATQLEEKFNNISKTIYCKDELLNKILVLKVNEAKKENVEFDIEANGINNFNMTEIDKISLFTNIIDNAIRAAKESTQKRIKLEIFNDHNDYEIKLVNSCDKIIHKADSVYHGKGKQIIDDILKKYNGKIMNAYANNMYRVIIEIELKGD
ncbi:MAG: GHKL domain-containing protein [Candidatus Caccosoma sp.]|nr:GHKL domain-containing protein [Candidatus Caccosoma sp.]